MSFLHLIPKSLALSSRALVAAPWLDRADPARIAGLLALSAGTLVHVGAMHLLPMAGRETGRLAPLALGGGLLVALLIILAAGAD